MPAGSPQACSGCGLFIEGGAAGCQQLFEEHQLREMSDPRYARYHRLVVDVYALQHPDRYCRSAKSLAAHLGGLCCALEERERDVERALAALRRSLDGPSTIVKPELPEGRGALTLRDLTGSDPPALGAAVDLWARSTWAAHLTLQPYARELVAAALARYGPR